MTDSAGRYNPAPETIAEQSADLRDAMWNIAHRIAGQYRQDSGEILVRLHNPPLPVEFGGRS